MYPKAEIKDFTLKKTYGQKPEGARDSRWRALPLIHAACSRLLVFHDESSRQLEEVTLSHAPPQESPRARRSALTKWQLRGTHARTHRSSSGRGWPARTTPPACFLVTCGLVLHFHSANCLFIGSPRQPRSFHGVKPPPPFLPRCPHGSSRGVAAVISPATSFESRSTHGEYESSFEVQRKLEAPLLGPFGCSKESALCRDSNGFIYKRRENAFLFLIWLYQWILGSFKSSRFVKKRNDSWNENEILIRWRLAIWFYLCLIEKFTFWNWVHCCVFNIIRK